MTGFLWFVILLVLVSSTVVAIKWILEGLSRKGFVKTDWLGHFRAHWISYSVQAMARTMMIGFFMMTFLTLFQFTFHGRGGATAIAALIFLALLVSTCYLAGTTCYDRLRCGRYEVRRNRLHLEQRKLFVVVPCVGCGIESHRLDDPNARPSLG